jgi:hypothetical protein
MRTTTRTRSSKPLLSTLLVAAVGLAAGSARAQDPSAYGDDYVEADFARVVYLDGTLEARRSAADPGGSPTELLEPNAPLFPGDGFSTGVDGRVELQLAGGSLVRADRLTSLTLLALPTPGAELADNTVLQLTEGVLRLTAFLDEGAEFRIDTPAGSIYLFDDGEFRIEVDPDGTTRLLSRGGIAELSGEGGSVLVRGGTFAELLPGALPTGPDPFNTLQLDEFDAWVQAREDAERRGTRYAEAYEELPQEVRPYYRELDAHGEWVLTADYGYVWYPVRTAPGWRPYLDGRWYYGPRGYFWIGYEPWGWAPYHYGRWTWIGSYGWCWIPGRVFGGAWVAWSWGPSYVGWGPLDYWNRPAYYSAVHYGYYDYRCWTFVRYADFHRPRYARYAVGGDVVGDGLRHAAVVTRPPRVAPDRIAASPVAADVARRSAGADVAARVAVPDPHRRPRESLVDVERRMTRLAASRGATPGRTERAAASSGSRGAGSSTGRFPSRILAGADRAAPDAAGVNDVRGRSARSSRSTAASGAPSDVQDRVSSRGAAPRTPRTTPSVPSLRGAGRGAETRSVGLAPGETEVRRGRSATSPTAPRARSSEQQRTSERMRSLYEQMSRPRTTRQSAAPPTGSRPSTPSRAGSTPSRSRSQGAGTGSNDRSGSRQPQASRGSSNRSGSRQSPSARGSSGGSGSRQPQASRGSSNRSGSRQSPSARGSSNRSGSRRAAPNAGRGRGD